MSEKMEVVFSASRNLYPYLMIPVKSLLTHNHDAHVWLMLEDDSLPYDIPEQCVVVNVSGQTIFPKDGPNSRSAFTYLAMIRAAYALIFNGESYSGIPACPKLDKIISMDCDVVVCDSLNEIWECDLDNKWFGAVAQYKSNDRPVGAAHTYFNHGVTVFNLEQMRKDGVSEKAIELLNTKRYNFVDEEVLNILNISEGERKAVALNPRFNQHLEVLQTIKNVGVIHYAGERCVWQQDLDLVYRGHYLKPWLKYSEEDSCRRANIKF